MLSCRPLDGAIVWPCLGGGARAPARFSSRQPDSGRCVAAAAATTTLVGNRRNSPHVATDSAFGNFFISLPLASTSPCLWISCNHTIDSEQNWPPPLPQLPSYGPLAPLNLVEPNNQAPSSSRCLFNWPCEWLSNNPC